MAIVKRAPIEKKRSLRLSVALHPDIAEGARAASDELGISLSAWLAMAIGRAVRGHRLEAEVLERVLRETLGEQMQLAIEEQQRIGTPSP